MGSNGCEGLAVTGFYATQHVFEKAYGNYLGLCRLGQFVAHELGLKLVRMTCVTALAKLGDVGKTGLQALSKQLSSSSGGAGHPGAKHKMHLLLLERLIRENAFERIADLKLMREGFEFLRA